MQVDPNGDLFAFPMLPEVEGESYEERLERSRKAADRQRRDILENIPIDNRNPFERMFAKEAERAAAESKQINETVRDAQDWCERKERERRIGHPRATVERPATAGKW